MVHNRPVNRKSGAEIEAWIGGSLIKISELKTGYEKLPDKEDAGDKKVEKTPGEEKEENQEKLGGKRGKACFSRASRRRLMYRLCKTRKDLLPMFVTLTYPAEYPTPGESKRDFSNFCKRLKRRFRCAGWIWKLELQSRGAPHYHLLVWGLGSIDKTLAEYEVPKMWYEIAGHGDENHLKFHLGLLPGSRKCVEPLRSAKGAVFYAAKYMGKDVASSQHAGRWWGVRYAECIPWASPVLVELVDHGMMAELLRYMRRKMRIKGRAYKSLHMICDADHWFDRLDRLLDLWRQKISAKKYYHEKIERMVSPRKFQNFTDRVLGF